MHLDDLLYNTLIILQITPQRWGEKITIHVIRTQQQPGKRRGRRSGHS